MQILQDEIKFTLGQIDKFQLVAENSNKIVTNNQKNNNKKKLDNLNNLKLEEKIFLEGLVSQLYDEDITGLNVKQLIKIFDTYSISKSLENIEFLRNTYLESNPQDNIDLITIERMTLDLNKINFVIGVSITDIVNKKPSLNKQCLHFIVIDFISLAYTYLYLLNENTHTRKDKSFTESKIKETKEINKKLNGSKNFFFYFLFHRNVNTS